MIRLKKGIASRCWENLVRYSSLLLLLSKNSTNQLYITLALQVPLTIELCVQ